MQWSRTVILLSISFCLVDSEVQHVLVKGITMCNKLRTTAKVQLFDADTLDPDDHLNSTVTNDVGEFEVFGSEDEIGYISPYVIISHQCRTEKNCYRFSKYYVPQSSINGVYDMTFISLDIVTADEKEIC